MRTSDEQRKLDRLFERASKQEDEGHLRSAFRLFLSGAKQGDLGAQLNLGNYYCDGIGVKRNRALALYWWRRAYRNGHSGAAHNIGIMFRDEKNMERSPMWFGRARDADAKLEIAKIHLARNEHWKAVAI